MDKLKYHRQTMGHTGPIWECFGNPRHADVARETQALVATGKVVMTRPLEEPYTSADSYLAAAFRFGAVSVMAFFVLVLMAMADLISGRSPPVDMYSRPYQSCVIILFVFMLSSSCISLLIFEHKRQNQSIT